VKQLRAENEDARKLVDETQTTMLQVVGHRQQVEEQLTRVVEIGEDPANADSYITIQKMLAAAKGKPCRAQSVESVFTEAITTVGRLTAVPHA